MLEDGRQRRLDATLAHDRRWLGLELRLEQRILAELAELLLEGRIDDEGVEDRRTEGHSLLLHTD